MGTMSAGFVFRFLPFPATPLPPEYAFVPIHRCPALEAGDNRD
jgi:hypothetical protein